MAEGHGPPDHHGPHDHQGSQNLRYLRKDRELVSKDMQYEMALKWVNTQNFETEIDNSEMNYSSDDFYKEQQRLQSWLQSLVQEPLDNLDQLTHKALMKHVAVVQMKMAYKLVTKRRQSHLADNLQDNYTLEEFKMDMNQLPNPLMELVESHNNSDVRDIFESVQMHMQNKSKIMSEMGKEEQPLQLSEFPGSLGSAPHLSTPEIAIEEQTPKLDVFSGSLEIGRRPPKSEIATNEQFLQCFNPEGSLQFQQNSETITADETKSVQIINDEPSKSSNLGGILQFRQNSETITADEIKSDQSINDEPSESSNPRGILQFRQNSETITADETRSDQSINDEPSKSSNPGGILRFRQNSETITADETKSDQSINDEPSKSSIPGGSLQFQQNSETITADETKTDQSINDEPSESRLSSETLTANGDDSDSNSTIKTGDYIPAKIRGTPPIRAKRTYL